MMATKGQRFELDLDADDFTFNQAQDHEDVSPFADVVKEIKERESDTIPPPPQMKLSKTGFPEHRNRNRQSAFKQKQQAQKQATHQSGISEPSDRAILHQIAKKHGVSLESAKEKADISAENTRRINNMSLEDIEQARAELLSQMNPEVLQKFLKRANIEEDEQTGWDKPETAPATEHNSKEDSPGSNEKPETDATLGQEQSGSIATQTDKLPTILTAKQAHTHDDGFSTKDSDAHATIEKEQPESTRLSTRESKESLKRLKSPDASSTGTSKIPKTSAAGVHFPSPPRDPSKFVPLDPNSPDFLNQLKTHYFPDLPHDPNALSWLQEPTEEDIEHSSYNPSAAGVAPSAIRFGFNGHIITPSRSLEIPTSQGLHHHGDAPSSAGYTIPELALLSRSSLPNQRSVAYQILGRIFYRLGRGDFGPRGGELQEALWDVIERERPLEVIMAEANRDGGHVSAKAYATEALWLWRKGGGGDRGILQDGQTRAK